MKRIKKLLVKNFKALVVFSRTFDFHTIGLHFNVFRPKQNFQGTYTAVIPLFIEAAPTGEAPTINGDEETRRNFTFVENLTLATIKPY